MLKNTLAVVFTLILSASLLWTVDYARKPNYELFQQQTVRIYFVDSDSLKPISLCSGVYLGDRRVLTAGHCGVLIKDNVKAYIKVLGREEKIFARAELVDWEREGRDIPTSDLALLRLESDLKGMSPARLSCRMPELGEELYVVGMPHGLGWTITKGSVTTWVPRGKVEPGRWIQLDVTSVRGNSGGPVFDRDGYLVGIISHGLTKGPFGAPIGHNYAMSGREICEFLEKNYE